MPRMLTVSALCLLLGAAWAFWPTYLSDPSAAAPSLHGHAFLGAVWLLLLAAQPVLLRTRQRQVHRHLGRVGVAVGAAFVVSSVLQAGTSLRRMPPAAFAAEGRYVYLPLAMAVLFALALALAVRWRRIPAAHGRFMACTALPLLDPVLARLLFAHAPPLPAPWLYQVPAFGLIGLVLVAMWRGWPVGQPGRRALAVYAGVSVVVLAGYFVVPDWPAWQALVNRWRSVMAG